MFPVLDPKGVVALQERALMFHAVELMLIVVVPVFILTFFFAWWYRAGNTKAVYMPNWEHAKMDELIWWAIPFEIVLVLAALTWTSTHALDPHKPLDSATGQAPLVVQVVALPWKWLFIYPELGVATVNYIYMPVGRPVEFDVTADAPMNSFWIPQLGGQIYAMTGMVTRLNLEADAPGQYAGSSSNYSGAGFAAMRFTAVAVAPADFDAWVSQTQVSPSSLDLTSFQQLAQPGESTTLSYAAVQPDLYTDIVDTFMH